MHDAVKILKYLNTQEKGVTKSKIKKELSLSNSSKKTDKLLNILTERKLIKLDRKLYYLNRRFDIVIGQYITINNKKLVAGKDLFDNPEKIEVPDVYKLEALIKDRVIVVKSGTVGKIVFVLEHGIKNVIGTYIENNGIGYVICEDENIDRDILIENKYKNGAFPYDKVKVEIFPDASTKKPQGQIVKIFGTGYEEENHLSLEDILEINKINVSYPNKALKQLNKLSQEDIKNSLFGRKDLTNEIIFTIDGIDSKDLDDAISIKRLDNENFELGVHIADVSHYVPEGSALDNEALNRGSSIYLIDTVIPMLPSKLSNQLCSLNPNETRLTLSCVMQINREGKVIESNIFESYISSRAKLNYDEVNAYFEKGNIEFENKYPYLLESLEIMRELKEILSETREKRGSIEFGFQESKITLDENNVPASVKPYPRGFANDMIEEFMLITNETVAFTYFNKNIPFIYRIHKSPTNDKYKRFVEFVNKYGYKVEEQEEVTPKEIQLILNKVKGSDEELAINLMALHSMTQARYQMLGGEDDHLHFGLATYYYCHFTSPIRRYPDLMIHRIIKDDLHGVLGYRDNEETKDLLSYVAKQSSKRERISQQVEEQYEMVKKMEYMEMKEGMKFSGIITSLHSNKIEITLDNTIVGVLLLPKNQNLKFNEKEYIIVDNAGKTIYELGKRLEVEMDSVDWSNVQIILKEA